MQRFSTCLWFDHQAEEAARFYTAVFRNARVTSTSHYSEAGQEIHGRPPGTVVTVEFELEGQAFVALNGGPHVAFTPAISFMVNCDTAAEVDALWSRLADGGIPLMALDSYPFSDRYGWIQDRYGVSWQLILGQGAARQKIMPVLMFVGRKYGKAEEAIRFYTSVFPNAKAGSIFRYGPGQTLDRPEAVAYADFELDGRLFAVMESGYATIASISRKPFPSSSTAGTSARWTITGTSSRPTRPTASAAGSRIATAFPGRSSRPFCTSCCGMRMPRSRSG